MKIFNINREKRLIAITFCFLALVFIAGCRKFVEVPPPTSQLVTASVFNNDATATSTVTNIYTQMFGESYSISVDNGLLADELTNYASNTNQGFAYYTNAMYNSNIPFGEWLNAYNYIYQANAVISGLQQYTGTSGAVKNQLTGEAYFIRAFWHFYLTNTYGAVPVALTTDYTVVDKLSRTPRIKVLQQVISDLLQSEQLLNSNYIDASDTATTADRVRPNKAVAEALLARAYLYLANYNNNDMTSYGNAYEYSSLLIKNSSEYNLCMNLSGPNSVFLKNSSEAIWQLYTPLPSGADTEDGNQFILTSRPTGEAVSAQLLSAFESGDQRRVNWIGTWTDSTVTPYVNYYFPFKYKQKVYSGTEYTMVLRLAEQYLIRAEAEAYGANGKTTSDAIADLDIIRNRAGLPDYSGATDQPSVLTAILHERQVELFTEWGARWFDLNRAVNTASTTNVNTVMSVVTPLKGGTWSTSGKQELYPIPLSDIEKDPNLTQNAGY